MEKKKFRVTLDIWIARIGALFGWIFLLFWVLMGIVGLAKLPEASNRVETVMPFVCLGLAALHVPLIRATRRTKKLVEDFRRYSSVLAQDPDKAIAGISDALRIPQEQVIYRLQEMCSRGYFSGHINFTSQRMELNPGENFSVERCPGCGAPNAVSRTGDTCRYCGSPLRRSVDRK